MKTRTSLLLAIFAMAFCIVACATPDPVVTTKIKAQLLADEAARPYSFEVTTKDGVVTITANIDSQEAKDRAIQIARQTRGVVDVVDMIAVRTSSASADAPNPQRTAGEHIDDATITMHVKSRLLEDPQVKGLKIDVDTREGVVFLTGTVRRTQEKDKAIELAKDTQGVRDVQANLKIETT